MTASLVLLPCIVPEGSLACCSAILSHLKCKVDGPSKKTGSDCYAPIPTSFHFVCFAVMENIPFFYPPRQPGKLPGPLKIVGGKKPNPLKPTPVEEEESEPAKADGPPPKYCPLWAVRPPCPTPHPPSSSQRVGLRLCHSLRTLARVSVRERACTAGSWRAAPLLSRSDARAPPFAVFVGPDRRRLLGGGCSSPTPHPLPAVRKDSPGAAGLHWHGKLPHRRRRVSRVPRRPRAAPPRGPGGGPLSPCGIACGTACEFQPSPCSPSNPPPPAPFQRSPISESPPRPPMVRAGRGGLRRGAGVKEACPLVGW